METDKNKSSPLRIKAEKIIGKQLHREDNSSEDDQYIHELHVHQIELELQNEELRKAQIKLEEARRKYFDLYNFAPVGYFTLDKNGIIMDVNLAGAALFGKERIYLNKNAFIHHIISAERNKFHKYLSKVLETNRKQTIELELLKNNDHFFYGLLETVKVLNEDETFKEYRVTVTDITELKNKENNLKRQTALLNLSNEAIYSWEYDDGIISWNHGAEILYGYSAEEAIGHNNIKLLKTEFPEEFKDIKQKLYDDGIWKGEVVHTTQNSTKIIVESHQQLINDNSTDIVIEANRDITKRRKMEKLIEERGNKLENINKMLNVEIGDFEKSEIKLEKLIEKYKVSNNELEQFAYVSSHDLKEPLRMITSFLDLLKKNYGVGLDENANEYIDFAVDGAKRLDMMINDLLDYSRIGKESEEFGYLNSEKILETVLTNLKPLIEENNAVITHDDLPFIFANSRMMNQLFQNIIGNAIKYHGEKQPEIHISSSNAQDECIFSVKDNGIGIDKKYLDKIFIIFQRLNSRDEYEGTGIGLAISEKIVKKHKGRIWAESELGNGTTFYFSIPNRTTRLNQSYLENEPLTTS
ncbi:PAS/PAC sensor signal transduction histidine kinase [Methanobacterium lacus]|uniref:histidine kinase n=1 Tax=Methanobacterium lacus (strain AL-21) TaxID=877455 RepID=F0T7K1_METLA|nr:PAS domain-containing sensor histidine kinase [Methanobacterium lacus]ADZ09569.1 PAS/PAC sensor signal transduction histidine kinase [Methanobacterium lacus]